MPARPKLPTTAWFGFAVSPNLHGHIVTRVGDAVLADRTQNDGLTTASPFEPDRALPRIEVRTGAVKFRHLPIPLDPEEPQPSGVRGACSPGGQGGGDRRFVAFRVVPIRQPVCLQGCLDLFQSDTRRVSAAGRRSAGDHNHPRQGCNKEEDHGRGGHSPPPASCRDTGAPRTIEPGDQQSECNHYCRIPLPVQHEESVSERHGPQSGEAQRCRGHE